MSATVESILERHRDAGREALIPLLQELQEAEGFISEEAVTAIGRHLRLPASKIYGVATFYNQFRFQPRGRFHVMVCRGTACHVKNSARVLDTVRRTLKLEPGQTARDRQFSLEVVACMGACGLSPVININGEFHAKVTPRKVEQILEECRGRVAAGEEASHV
jgi:NADH-quinone oxidoreductase subunit E